MRNTDFNIASIVSYDYVQNELMDNHYYLPEIKIFGMTIRPEGIYEQEVGIKLLCRNPYLYVKEGKVYHKPYVIFRLTNGDIYNVVIIESEEEEESITCKFMITILLANNDCNLFFKRFLTKSSDILFDCTISTWYDNTFEISRI